MNAPAGVEPPQSTILRRLFLGVCWSWVSDTIAGSQTSDVATWAMSVKPVDRLHRKQGRLTARVRIDAAHGQVPAYLKRHERLGFLAGVRALLAPRGRHTPARSEWEGYLKARRAGVRVPEALAVGERIGPWCKLQSFLIIGELTGRDELNRVTAQLSQSLDPNEFATWKRRSIGELAALVARLHYNKLFHKDLYLCHIFVSVDASATDEEPVLIDLHRLARHSLTSFRWRVKDLAQLLFSTYGVHGIDDRDRLRFWRAYRALAAPPLPGLTAALVRAKAARYARHNLKHAEVRS